MASMIKTLFTKYPLLSNAVVYGTFATTAEFTQQLFTRKLLVKQEERRPFDTGTLARYAIVGTCYYPNILYLWYKWLDGKYIGTARDIIIKKLLLDQFLMTPPVLSGFFIVMSALEGQSDLFAEWRQKFMPTFVKNCYFWLPAQAINFVFVPQQARVVYIAGCSFAWLNILVYVKRQKVNQKNDKP